MKILNSSQTREADKYTIEHEPVSSIDLMERSAMACFGWIKKKYSKDREFFVFCGPGNNGGDGLAITRILIQSGYKAHAFIINHQKYSDDFLENEKRLRKKNIKAVFTINSKKDFPKITSESILIDAIFGSGLSKPVDGLSAEVIRFMNASGAEIIAIDLPSGCFADQFTDASAPVVHAIHTLTFQLPKFAFFFSCNEVFMGEWHILEIGLDQAFIDKQVSTKNYFLAEDAKHLLKTRKKFSHKGIYGHALLLSGSKGKMGAAVLAAKACIRAGTGLLTAHVPACGLDILQTTVPEAMISVDSQEDHINSLDTKSDFTAIGIGPGIGTHAETWKVLQNLLEHEKKPMVIDADALNLLSEHKDWLKRIPKGSILTPHPKEFERLTKKVSNDFERHDLQIEFARHNHVIVVLKGAYTCIASPDGNSWFNSTGNPGMARGGSGDALTGIILALLAQSYSPLDAALLGVYIHGLAGDEAAHLKTIYAMTPGDLIKCLPFAFRRLMG